jgi:hypothetical protein
VEQGSPRNKLTRRELIARGSIGAAAIWTTPVVTSLAARAAAATPPPCACTGLGRGLFGEFTQDTDPNLPPRGDGQGGESSGAEHCDEALLFNPNPNPFGVSFSAMGTCGAFDVETCTATSEFGKGSFSITVFGLTISGTTIQTTITTGGCDCSFGAVTTAVGLNVGGQTFAAGPIPFTVIPLTGPAGTATVTLNNQFCDMTTGESVVQGLVMEAVGAPDGNFAGESGTMILSESRVKTPGCQGLCLTAP